VGDNPSEHAGLAVLGAAHQVIEAGHVPYLSITLEIQRPRTTALSHVYVTAGDINSFRPLRDISQLYRYRRK